MSMSDRQEPIHVRYDEDETGWVLPVAGNLVRIDNIPFTDRYNIEDLVELEPPEGEDLPRLGRVVRREYDGKTLVYYDEDWQFWELKAVLRILGGEIEGGAAPNENGPGFMLIAHPRRIDGAKLAEALGLRPAQDTDSWRARLRAAAEPDAGD